MCAEFPPHLRCPRTSPTNFFTSFVLSVAAVVRTSRRERAGLSRDCGRSALQGALLVQPRGPCPLEQAGHPATLEAKARSQPQCNPAQLDLRFRSAFRSA